MYITQVSEPLLLAMAKLLTPAELGNIVMLHSEETPQRARCGELGWFGGLNTHTHTKAHAHARTHARTHAHRLQ